MLWIFLGTGVPLGLGLGEAGTLKPLPYSRPCPAAFCDRIRDKMRKNSYPIPHLLVSRIAAFAYMVNDTLFKTKLS